MLLMMLLFYFFFIFSLFIYIYVLLAVNQQIFITASDFFVFVEEGVSLWLCRLRCVPFMLELWPRLAPILNQTGWRSNMHWDYWSVSRLVFLAETEWLRNNLNDGVDGRVIVTALSKGSSTNLGTSISPSICDRLSTSNNRRTEKGNEYDEY